MDLWRRRTPEQTAAAERVRLLLTARSTGWVPPPVDALEVDDPGGPGQHGVTGPPVGDAVADVLVPDSDRGPRGGVEPDPDVPRQSAPLDHPSGRPRHLGAANGLLALLRAGRLDPGRRAVAGLAVLAVVACLVAGALVLRGRPHLVAPPQVQQVGVPVPGEVVSGPVSPAPAGAATPPAGGPAPVAHVVVAVAGAVRRPGLVTLPAGSRVDDAVRAAGGVRPGGTLGLLNLARRLLDGEQVLVGTSTPVSSSGTVSPSPPAGDGAGGAAVGRPVDLNTATAAELDALPGIGPVLAQRIVDHRTRNGPFRSVEDLRQVSGIGEAKFATLRSSVTV